MGGLAEAREQRFLRSSGSTLDRHKKGTLMSILGAYSSLCLRLFCAGDFGGAGDGANPLEGPTPTPTLPDPGKGHP